MSKKVFNGLKGVVTVFILAVLTAGGPDSACAQTNTNNAPIAATPLEIPALNELLRASIQLQAQIQEAKLTIQRAGQQSEVAAIQNTAMLSNRLQAVEQAIEVQHSHELKVVHDIMIIAGAFVVVGVFALLFTAYFHWRAVSKLAEIAAALPTHYPAPVPAPVAALGLGENQLLLERNSSRLTGAIERLEKRISEIEREPDSSSNGRPAGNGKGGMNGASNVSDDQQKADAALPDSPAEPPARVLDSSHAEQFVSLLNKGQLLLNQDQADEALACFEEALALDPNHAEMLVKKGDALEKLHRTQDAIACYDRALTLDNSLTIAYLHKGGLLNRLERFDEAMLCYEQALKSQEKKRAA